MKKRKNSTFTIIAFIIVAGILALCVYGIVDGLTNSDDSKTETTNVPIVTTSSDNAPADTDEPDVSSTPDSSKQPQDKNKDQKQKSDSTTKKKDQTTSSQKTTADKKKKNSKKDKKSPTLSEILTEQGASGKDNVISFDEFQ